MISAANHVPLTPLSFLARARLAFPDKVAMVDADDSTETTQKNALRDRTRDQV